jgi:type I restriction enzyme S subunit
MKVNFYDVVDVISGGTPRTDVGEFWNGEIPWLSVVDFAKSVKYVYDTEKHITEMGLKNSNTKLLNIDDIIISARGTVGAIAMLKIPMAFNQSCFGLRAKREFMNQDYLFYFLKYYMENLKKKTQGSVFSTINLETFRMIDFELPDTNTQIKISKILSCLDSKIENNNKINAELESMAKTLYDYWFLQFEFPNENGKPYKSSGGKMVWNEELKREIPEGWEAIKLKNIVKKTNRVYDYNKDSKTYDLSIMPSNSISINDTSSSKDFETNLFAVKEGDILFGSIRPYLRKAGIASYDGAVAGTIHCYEVIKESNYNLALFTLTSENIFKYAINNSKGTKMPVITSDDLLEFMLPYNEEIAKKFNNIKIREIIIANIKQSNELASLRDFLLPLLMNGQVKFKDN